MYAASNTYTSPTTPGSAPSDSVSTVLYQHADHLTSRVTTENDGDLSNQQAHYPYGESWYTDGTADPSVKRKFTSYRKETDSSLASGQINYAIARYHGARIGRFHSADPMRGNFRNPQRLNRYAYVTGNPISRIDPRGTDDIVSCGGGECLIQDVFNASDQQGTTYNSDDPWDGDWIPGWGPASSSVLINQYGGHSAIGTSSTGNPVWVSGSPYPAAPAGWSSAPSTWGGSGGGLGGHGFGWGGDESPEPNICKIIFDACVDSAWSDHQGCIYGSFLSYQTAMSDICSEGDWEMSKYGHRELVEP